MAKREVPRVFAEYKQGKTIPFGPLSISQEGLAKGKTLLPWSSITLLRVHTGLVTIEEQRQWRYWPLVRVAKIPNFFTFLALVHFILDGRVTYTAPSEVEETEQEGNPNL